MRNVKPTVLSLSALLLVFAGVPTLAHAQTQEKIVQRSQTDVPKESWIYSAIKTLDRPGRRIAYEGRSFFQFHDTLSRLEAAVFTARLLDNEEARYKRAPNQSATNVQSSPVYSKSEVVLVRRLFVELTPEMKVANAYNNDWIALINKMEQDAQTQEPSDQRLQGDIPRDSWVYPAINTLYTDEFIRQAQGRWPREVRALTRYEAAVAVARMLDKLDVAAIEGRRSLTDKEKNNPVFRPTNVRLLYRLVNEFAKEMQILGVDVNVARKRIEQLETVARRVNPGTPFADVPTTHWAFSSVEKLRQQGIIVGYPGGTLHAFSTASVR